MAYFTGKDVDVWITTEHLVDCVSVTNNELVVTDQGGVSSLADARQTKASSVVFSGALANAGSPQNRMTDVTGCDLSVGATDEDLNFFGLRNVGKIEIKKDTSLTITRKKSNNNNMVVFQGNTNSTHSPSEGLHGARWGLINSSGMKIADGSVDPKSTLDDTSPAQRCYGYRVFIELKGTTDGTGTVLVIPNCTLMDYSGTIANDAANEESFTLTSMVKPILMNDTKFTLADGGAHDYDYFGTADNAAVGFVTQTAAADM